MKKLLFIFVMLFTFPAYAYMAKDFEQPLHLAQRDRHGTLKLDIARVQTYNGQVSQRKLKINLHEVRRVIICSITPENCTRRNVSDSNYLNRTRSE